MNHPIEAIREPTRNAIHVNLINIRSDTDIAENSRPIFTIYQDNLPSYNDVIIEDLPSYEEIMNRNYDQPMAQR